MNQILEWSPLIVFFIAFKLLGMYWATAALMSSKSGLPHWSIDWPNSKADPNRRPDAKNPLAPDLLEDLAAQLAKFDAAAVAQAVDGAMIAAARQFADGIEAYRRHLTGDQLSNKREGAHRSK